MPLQIESFSLEIAMHISYMPSIAAAWLEWLASHGQVGG